MVTLFLIVLLVSVLILFIVVMVSERFDITNSGFLFGIGLAGTIGLIVGAFGVVIATNFEKTEYEVYKVVHYQAVGSEELNQVWLKDEDGDYFYIIVNDKDYNEIREQNEEGNRTYIKLSNRDLEGIPTSKN